MNRLCGPLLRKKECCSMKGKPADKSRLQHILEAIREVEKYLSAVGDENGFYSNSAFKFATVKQLEIIGEAAGKLSDETKKLANDLDWKAIISMRNRLVHDYENIDFTIVYQVAIDELPVLREATKKMLQNLQ